MNAKIIAGAVVFFALAAARVEAQGTKIITIAATAELQGATNDTGADRVIAAPVKKTINTADILKYLAEDEYACGNYALGKFPGSAKLVVTTNDDYQVVDASGNLLVDVTNIFRLAVLDAVPGGGYLQTNTLVTNVLGTIMEGTNFPGSNVIGSILLPTNFVGTNAYGTIILGTNGSGPNVVATVLFTNQVVVTNYVPTTNIVSGRINNRSGLYAPKLTEQYVLRMTYDDSSINGGVGLSFLLQGVTKRTITDSAANASGTYHQTVVNDLADGAGTGVYQGAPFIISGRLTISGRESLTLSAQ